MNNKSLNAYRGLLITLITATAITGISFLDNYIWNIVIAGVGVATYGIVGFLYSAHLISSKGDGNGAYLAVFIILLIIGIIIYYGILKVEQWILSWPLFVKILVPSMMGVGVILITTFLIINRIKQKNCDKVEDEK